MAKGFLGLDNPKPAHTPTRRPLCWGCVATSALAAVAAIGTIIALQQGWIVIPK